MAIMRLGMSSSTLRTTAVTTAPSKAYLRLTFTSFPSPAKSRARTAESRRSVAVKAGSGQDVDFDKILNNLADKFEKSDNKAAVIGYSAAAVGAIWASEWLIHLPLFNFLLGFPIQLLGLVLLPYFSVKYFLDKDSITSDASKAVDRVAKKLPGFDK